ncbi:dual specificity protein phosphatase 23 isoform X3 [Phalacrocorax aristotelis]|uniref:dual specificity protein phosphatase 23 isoform X3 n=1 Tax=Phalacrocorax aristotelis TaxID=126867 RepID=UPI003F4B922E
MQSRSPRGVQPQLPRGGAVPALPGAQPRVPAAGASPPLTDAPSQPAPPLSAASPRATLRRRRPPSPIQSFLQLVEEANARREAVAVHCLLGHGRTGTMLACYLAKAQKMSGGDAIREIRRLRPGSIETREQEQAVIQFCQRICSGEDSEEA